MKFAIAAITMTIIYLKFIVTIITAAIKFNLVNFNEINLFIKMKIIIKYFILGKADFILFIMKSIIIKSD